MEQCIWKNTVVPLWNQMQWFFPLVILGNKPRIPSRSMVRECDRGKWFSNIPVISEKTVKEEYVLNYSFFRQIPIGKGCSLCCSTKRTRFSIQWESALPWLPEDIFFPRARERTAAERKNSLSLLYNRRCVICSLLIQRGPGAWVGK